jgi:predicted membrane protein
MKARYAIGAIFIILGVSALTGMDLGRFIFPLFLIYIGWRILSKEQGHFDMEGEKIKSSSQSSINETFIFSGTERRLNSENFNGGRITAIFGGANLDLSNTKTKKKVIELDIAAVFGGVKIRVPKDWEIESEAVGILGGIDNKTSLEKKSATLRITGVAIFGGVNILN